MWVVNESSVCSAFLGVGALNIGQAAAGSAAPVPTGLLYDICHKIVYNSPISTQQQHFKCI